MDDLNAKGLVTLGLDGLDCIQAANQCDSTARNDALLNRSAGGVQCIFHPGLLLLELDLGGGAHVDHSHAADQLGQALLQLLAVVVGGGVLGLCADLLDATLDGLAAAGSVDHHGLVLRDHDALGLSEVAECQ